MLATVRALLLVGRPFVETFHMERVCAGQRPSVCGLYLLQADRAVHVFILGRIVFAIAGSVTGTIGGSFVRSVLWLRLIVEIVHYTDGSERYNAHGCSEGKYLWKHHLCCG